MLRKLALSLAVSAALGASQVNALGLGEIKVNSALNEPLDAEIKLTQVRDLSPLQIQPRMASLDEYMTAAGSSSRYLRDIQFQVFVSPEGTGRIRLKSSEPVQEPFLNFMVEVNWPSGRMVREYTLLLDPPVFEPSPVTRRLAPAQVQTMAPAPQARTTRATTSPAAAANNIRTRANTDTQVYVGVNDTLWEIAKKVKPAGVTEHQMMLALLRKNPKSFPSGNINNLKAGTVMDIPNAAEVGQLSHRESVAEVARQMQLWKDGRSAAATAAKAPLDVSKTQTESAESATAQDTEAPAPETTEEGKLTVLAPPKEEEAKTVSSATSSVDSDAEEATNAASGEQVISAAAERLEDEVLMAQEKIDRLERDNADLNEKLNSMLEQLESQSRLLELQSQQMSTLQAELSKPQPAAPVAAPAAAKDSASLLDNPGLLGGIGAGAIALLGGLWLLMRRKRSADVEPKRELVNVPDDLRDEDRDAVPDVAVAGAAALAGGAAAVALAQDDNDNAQPADDSDFVRPPMDSLAPAEEEEAVSDLDQDLQELDLDMDLDLDDLDQEPLADESIDSAEFDLGIDDEPLADLSDEDELAADELDGLADEDAVEADDELEFALNPVAEEDDTSSELDSMLGDQEVDDLDFLLGDDAAAGDDDLTLDLDGDEEIGEALDFAVAAPAEAVADAETDEVEVDNSLHETVEAVDEVEFEVDPALEAMLQGNSDSAEADEEDGLEFNLGFADDDAAESTDEDSAEDDLDSLLSSFDPEDASDAAAPLSAMTSEAVEEELTANISHDLEMDLDAEVDELLGSTDDEIELDEQRNDEQVEVLDKMNLLSDADEIETKLDLARAYIEMEDTEGARDILNEITSEGSDTQRSEAQKLLETLA